MLKASLSALLLVAGLVSCMQTPPQWYRGNLHTHSLWSDGNDVPEMICDWYKKNGYQFLAISDHNILSDVTRWMDVDLIIRRGGRSCIGRYKKRFGDEWVETRTRVDAKGKKKTQVRLKQFAEYRGLFEETGTFLLIQSEEVSAGFQRLPIHINVTNVQEKIKPPRGESVRDVMSRVLEMVEKQSSKTGEPMLAHLNHPNFGYAITAEDLAAVVQERFFEVWNGHPAVGHRGDHHHASVERIWDIANTLRIAKLGAPPLMGLGTDDSHQYFNENPRQSISGRGWVMVRAAHLTPASLIQALGRGDFYASSGVTLTRYDCTESTIELEIKSSGDETFVTQFIGTLEGYDDSHKPVADDAGKEVPATHRYSHEVGAVLATVRGRHPRYEMTGKELYVRAVVTSSAKPTKPVFDDQRKKAWTQPVGWRTRLR
jgi:hypothetical protein